MTRRRAEQDLRLSLEQVLSKYVCVAIACILSYRLATSCAFLTFNCLDFLYGVSLCALVVCLVGDRPY